MVVDSSGNVYVTGFTYMNGRNRDYATVKYNSAGVEQWAVTYEGTGNGSDSAEAIAVDASGNVYVTGWSLGTGYQWDYDFATIKYDTNGNEIWVKRYNGIDSDDDRGYAVTVDALGNVYITGWSYIWSSDSYDFLTIKYDSDGNEIWVSNYDSPEHGQGGLFDCPRLIKQCLCVWSSMD